MSSQNLVIRLIRQQILNTSCNLSEDEDRDNALLNRLISLTEGRSERNNSRINTDPPMEEEEFLRRLQQFMPHRDLETIRSVLERVGNNTRTRSFQDSLISHFNRRSEQLEREEPSNIRYYREDDIAESFDDLLKEEESSDSQNLISKIKEKNLNLLSNDYIDYKQYPCLINWDKLNDDKSMAYETMESFGYFGCFIYINLGLSEIKVKYYKLDTELINLVNKYLSDHNGNDKFERLIKCLPSLWQIKQIIEGLMIREKELILIKIVLDIHQIYLRFISKNQFILLAEQYNLYFSVALNFVKLLKTSVLVSSKEFKTAGDCLIEKIKSKTALYNGYCDLKKKFKVNYLVKIETFRRNILKLKTQHQLHTLSFSAKDFIV